MRKSYAELVKEKDKYLEEYPKYTSDEKLNSMNSILNIINSISTSPEFRVTDLEQVQNLRDTCIKLDCTLGLIYLDTILAKNWYYNRESLNILREDSEVYLPKLIKRSLKPYVTEGLEHQLGIGERLFMKHDDLGNEKLSRDIHSIFNDIIKGTMWLEVQLKELKINIALIRNACKDFAQKS